MKKMQTTTRTTQIDEDDLLPECDIDYNVVRPNRFIKNPTSRYRVFRGTEGELSLYRVFYGEDDKLVERSTAPMRFKGNSVEALVALAEWVQVALTLPVLDLDSLPVRDGKQPKTNGRRKNITHQQLLAKLNLKPARTPST